MCVCPHLCLLTCTTGQRAARTGQDGTGSSSSVFSRRASGLRLAFAGFADGFVVTDCARTLGLPFTVTRGSLRLLILSMAS